MLDKVLQFACEDGFDVVGLDYSPIKGGQGNIEFLAHLVLRGETGKISPTIDKDQVIDAAYADLKKH